MADMTPVITVWQPWASLIAANAKPFEFRGWKPPARFCGKRIGIHAGARKVNMREVRELMVKLHSPNWRETALNRDIAIPLLAEVLDTGTMWLSSIVFTALFGTPVRDAELASQLGTAWCNDSDRDQHSNWGWPLSDVKRVDPAIPATGRQGIWYFDLGGEAADA